MAAEALVDIQRILTKYKLFSNVTTWYEDGKAITKIILKDSTGLQLNPPATASSVSGIPEESRKTRASRKKKNPSKLRRDAKRRDTYVAKRNSEMSSKAAEGNLFSSSFITTPQRRASLSGIKVIPDTVGDSPIPQLDGGERSLNERAEIEGGEIEGAEIEGGEIENKIDKDFLMRQIREWTNELKEKNKGIPGDEAEQNDDQIEDTKIWTRKQKKSQ